MIMCEQKLFKNVKILCEPDVRRLLDSCYDFKQFNEHEAQQCSAV